MFNLGLELEQKQIKRQWEYSLPISIATIIVPYRAGAALSIYMYDIYNRDGFKPPDRTAFILFAASISCAAMNNVIGWCSLTLAGTFAKGSGIAGLWVILISVGYVLFMFIIVRWSINRLASSFFCDTLDIHSFFGAFIVGVICLKSGQFTLELFEKIELITVELLLPLFFAASGMRTSLGSLNDKLYGDITVVIFAVDTLAKFLPATLMTKCVTKRSWRFSTSVGILMNTRGLIELIALNIGLQLNILSPRLFTMFLIIALVTTFMTSSLLWLVYL
ncbi:unnamed protein product [Rotaria socialis]|uniref:Cation/H+ exchanger transmembrane domain-containing protein n=1 Tax=Rotaria socialis TaxID=392032 RepID=A0A820JVE3_9BILA|nr:unnamed protein product [Rotaria socialis]CAF4456076.1 unnamed protein product [Rotaria socialis]CAF4825721.1 unnamed protein product [Rotaria socialis]